jgi:hypothetical protein
MLKGLKMEEPPDALLPAEGGGLEARVCTCSAHAHAAHMHCACSAHALRMQRTFRAHFTFYTYYSLLVLVLSLVRNPTHYSPLHHLPLTTHHSPLTTHHLPLATCHLPLTTNRLPLTAY